MTVFHEAADPATPASRLAELAFEHPEVRPVVAMHPAAYDGLLDWLNEHGDPNTRAAVALRRGTAMGSDAPMPAPAAAIGGPAPLPTSEGVHSRLPLLIGGGVLGVVAIVVVAVLVIPQLTRGTTAGVVPVADLGSRPSTTWSISSPLTEQAGTDWSLGVKGTTVGPGRAVIQWDSTVDDGDSGDSPDPHLSLVDTSSGSVIWDVADKHADDSVYAVDAKAVAVSDGETLTSFDLGDGHTLGNLRGFDSVLTQSLPPDSSSTAGARIAVRDGDRLSVYSASNLDKPLWKVDKVDSEDGVSITQGLVIVGKKVYSSTDGTPQAWTADTNSYYIDHAGALYETDTDRERTARIDPTNGKELWSVKGQVGFLDGAVLSDNGKSVTAYDEANGDKLWESDGGVSGGASLYAANSAAGVVVLPAPADQDAVQAYDARTGDKLWKLDVSDKGDWTEHVVAFTATTLYLAGNEDAQLLAYDARTGERRWSMENPQSNWYTFSAWGGNIVAYRSGQSSSDSGSHPQVVGLG